MNNLASAKVAKTIATIVVFFVVPAVFWPGLTGSFMLDDYGSLPTLYRNIEGCGWWCGVLTGSTGPTGRPFSLITFAFQASHWPDPYYFKLVNVLIHTINSIILFFIAVRLLKKLGVSENSYWISLGGVFLWSILPIQISSVLYVIQRMALLSSMFMLIGVLYYLKHRDKLVGATESPSKFLKHALALSGIGVCAILFKESGVLLLVYILIIELIAFRGEKGNDGVKFFRWIILYMPILIVVLYLAVPILKNPDGAYHIREFTLSERVLTQGRVLFEYLSNAFFPRASYLGLYHDDFKASSGIFNPLTTFGAWLGLVMLLVGAYLIRARFTLFSLAVFWFFGGHILESTIIPLELYFEHRNYLPLAMLALFVSASTYLILRKLKGSMVTQAICKFAICAYLAITLYMTYSQSSLWGDEFEYSLVQAAEHPESIRARALAVEAYSQAGLLAKSYKMAEKMAEDFPGVGGLAVMSLDYHCVDPKFSLEPVNVVSERLKVARFGYGAIKTFSNYLNEYESGYCNHVNPEYVLSLVRALRLNPIYSRRDSILRSYEVRLLGLLGRYDEAISLFERHSIKDDDWVIYIRYLAIVGRLEEALNQSGRALEALRLKPYYSEYIKEVRRIRGVVINDIENSNVAKEIKQN